MGRLQLILVLVLGCSAVAAAQQAGTGGGSGGAIVNLPLGCGDLDPYCAYFPGRVGIGIPDPTASLDVRSGYGTFTMPSGSGLSAGIGIYQDDVANNQGRWLLFSRATGHFTFFNIGAGRDVLRLFPNGNVGIGTATPGQALELSRTNADVGLNFNSLNADGSSAGSFSLGANYSSGRHFFINRGTFPGQALDFNMDAASGAIGLGTSANSPYRLSVSGSLNLSSGSLYVNSGQVVNSSGQWVGGAVTAIGAVQGTSLTTPGAVQAASVTATGTVQGTLVKATGDLEIGGVLKVDGTTVINSAGEWVGPIETETSCQRNHVTIIVPSGYPSGTFWVSVDCPAGTFAADGGFATTRFNDIFNFFSGPDANNTQRRWIEFFRYQGSGDYQGVTHITCCTTGGAGSLASRSAIVQAHFAPSANPPAVASSGHTPPGPNPSPLGLASGMIKLGPGVVLKSE